MFTSKVKAVLEAGEEEMQTAYVLGIVEWSVRRLFVERLLDVIKIICNMENRLQWESREDKRQLMGF
jgi:hypothetical protein